MRRSCRADAGVGPRSTPVMRIPAVLSTFLVAAFNCAAASSPVVIPFKIRGHFPIVVAKIDGIDVPLQFDSGDQSTVALQQSILDQIKAVPTGESSEQRYARGKEVQSPKFRVPRIQIGRAVFTDIIGRLDIHDPSYPATDIGQKGFLGTGLFKSYEVVLDYPHRTMTLVPRINGERPSKSCQGTVVPFSPEWHGEPVTQTDTDLGKVTLWWDTGAPTSVLSKRLAREARPHLAEDTVMSKQFSLGGVDFGPWRFDVWDMSLPAGFDGFIGYNFFARHIVCIDFPGRRIVIRR